MNLIEEVKNFWDKKPCNIKHSNKPIGTKEYFDEVEYKKYFVENHIPEFAEFGKWKNKKVLEIGCGIGTDSINFVRNGADLTCVELSEKTLEVCKKRFEVYGLNAKFICCNAEELDNYIFGETYDLIYSFGVIHHSPNTKKIVENLCKFSQKDTVIKIMIYSLFSFKTIESLFKFGHKFKFNPKKSIEYYAESQLGCPVARTYLKKDVEKLFENYRIISIEKKHIFPYIVKDYVNHVYKKRWFFNFIPQNFFRKLEKYLGWHWLIELKLK